MRSRKGSYIGVLIGSLLATAVTWDPLDTTWERIITLLGGLALAIAFVEGLEWWVHRPTRKKEN